MKARVGDMGGKLRLSVVQHSLIADLCMEDSGTDREYNAKISGVCFP